MLFREVWDENGLDFGGYHIPKGTGLAIPVKWLHFGENSWTDSIKFNPKRFDKSNGETKQDRGDLGRYNNIPFATGLHQCLGMHLALNELRVYTALLLRDWVIEIDEDKLKDSEGIQNEYNLTAGIPHKNMYVKLHERV